MSPPVQIVRTLHYVALLYSRVCAVIHALRVATETSHVRNHRVSARRARFVTHHDGVSVALAFDLHCVRSLVSLGQHFGRFVWWWERGWFL